jgi:hypothetical protein
MNPEDVLNEILDTIEERVATALDISADQIYETRQTGEQEGAAAYVSASIDQIVPFTACAEKATVTVLIGFHMPEVETETGLERQRITRTRHTFAIRSQLLWQGSASPLKIPNVTLPRVTDMAVSELGDPDRGYLTGGLTYQFEMALPKPV